MTGTSDVQESYDDLRIPFRQPTHVPSEHSKYLKVRFPDMYRLLSIDDWFYSPAYNEDTYLRPIDNPAQLRSMNYSINSFTYRRPDPTLPDQAPPHEHELASIYKPLFLKRNIRDEPLRWRLLGILDRYDLFHHVHANWLISVHIAYSEWLEHKWQRFLELSPDLDPQRDHHIRYERPWWPSHTEHQFLVQFFVWRHSLSFSSSDVEELSRAGIYSLDMGLRTRPYPRDTTGKG